MTRWVSRTLLRVASLPLETKDEEVPVDAIVVLGCPLRADGNLSLAGRERVQEAVRLFGAGLAPLVAFTGGAAHSRAEAPAMASRARELGIPTEAILLEDKSTTTRENAVFIANVLREHNVETVWVVSQPFHLRRGRRLLRQQGFRAHARAWSHSIQYDRSDLALRWIGREYIAWLLHYSLPNM